MIFLYIIAAYLIIGLFFCAIFLMSFAHEEELTTHDIKEDPTFFQFAALTILGWPFILFMICINLSSEVCSSVKRWFKK